MTVEKFVSIVWAKIEKIGKVQKGCFLATSSLKGRDKEGTSAYTVENKYFPEKLLVLKKILGLPNFPGRNNL